MYGSSETVLLRGRGSGRQAFLMFAGRWSLMRKGPVTARSGRQVAGGVAGGFLAPWSGFSSLGPGAMDRGETLEERFIDTHCCRIGPVRISSRRMDQRLTAAREMVRLAREMTTATNFGLVGARWGATDGARRSTHDAVSDYDTVRRGNVCSPRQRRRDRPLWAACVGALVHCTTWRCRNLTRSARWPAGRGRRLAGRG